MKIHVLTPIYATTTLQEGVTPVVHYFTREWVKMGHDVRVFYLRAKFPRFFYWVSRLLQHKLYSRFGFPVFVEYPYKEVYYAEGVPVCKMPLRKIRPHSSYSSKSISVALNSISKECEENGLPDWFVGHWDNPQLELLCALKQRFHKPVCLVLHNNSFDFKRLKHEEAEHMLAQMDVIGFRNKTAQINFESQFGKPRRSFVAYSGVSDVFLDEGKRIHRTFEKPIRNFVFVGSLIEKKHPKEIITALSQLYTNNDCNVTFIGDGAEKSQIEKEIIRTGFNGNVHFTGRIPRESIVEYLKKSDVFVMVSHPEVFGLVYLEAMALGIITIGSKNEGIDGIIVDGKNGFLCNAGDVCDLVLLLNRIKNMPQRTLQSISIEAQRTAQEYSDYSVAKKYINALSTLSQ